MCHVAPRLSCPQHRKPKQTAQQGHVAQQQQAGEDVQVAPEWTEHQSHHGNSVQGDLGPRLNEERDPQYWFDQPGAPKPQLEDEEGQGETVAYDDLIQAWREGRVR